MKDYKRFFVMNVALGIAKVVMATAIGGELGKMCLSGDCQQARAKTARALWRLWLVAVEYDGGNFRQYWALTTEPTITVKADAAEP